MPQDMYTHTKHTQTHSHLTVRPPDCHIEYDIHTYICVYMCVYTYMSHVPQDIYI